MMRPPWLPFVVYGAVLAAGLHHQVRAGGVAQAAALVAAIGALAGLELVERRVAAPAAVFLTARTAMFVLVAALDGDGLSNLLFLLVPFAAYFAYGRKVAVTLAAAGVAVPVGWLSVADPHWYTDGERVRDVLMLAVGMCLAVAMAAAAVGESDSRARLRLALDEVAELSAAAERGRVARDLHDSLGHHLTAVSIQLEKAAAFRERDPVAADQSVRAARDSAARALHEVRGAVRALSAPFSLTGALADLAGEGVDVAVLGDEPDLPLAARIAVFRAAQEGVTNARRHAGAGRVTVRATFGGGTARLVVADDGHGFAAGAAEGFGLRGMRERLAAVGGSVAVTTGHTSRDADTGEVAGTGGGTDTGRATADAATHRSGDGGPAATEHRNSSAATGRSGGDTGTGRAGGDTDNGRSGEDGPTATEHGDGGDGGTTTTGHGNGGVATTYSGGGAATKRAGGGPGVTLTVTVPAA
ncbi:hypothetical protein GCM10009827_111820 [Dactylosporangium maewongense]|uniref:histidine kinase n=1 Tax=Dactylosporangium maewongense TaxID=634393 RepID=A0ABN2D6N4_9ACTN